MRNKLYILIFYIIMLFSNLLQVYTNSNIGEKDINSVRYFRMFFDDYIFIPIYIFIFLISLYLILSKYILKFILNNKKFKFLFNNKIHDIKEENESVVLKNKLLSLLEDIENLSKWEFYGKLNLLFRGYFEIIWIKWALKLTLKELQTKDINSEILKLFEESYYLEFSNKTTRIETRKKILKTFIEYV